MEKTKQELRCEICDLRIDKTFDSKKERNLCRGCDNRVSYMTIYTTVADAEDQYYYKERPENVTFSPAESNFLKQDCLAVKSRGYTKYIRIAVIESIDIPNPQH